MAKTLGWVHFELDERKGPDGRNLAELFYKIDRCDQSDTTSLLTVMKMASVPEGVMVLKDGVMESLPDAVSEAQ